MNREFCAIYLRVDTATCIPKYTTLIMGIRGFELLRSKETPKLKLSKSLNFLKSYIGCPKRRYPNGHYCTLASPAKTENVSLEGHSVHSHRWRSPEARRSARINNLTEATSNVRLIKNKCLHGILNWFRYPKAPGLLPHCSG